ncbi:MAG: hypothetical protein R2749_13365 [Acidimicrobiales bacterium]
MPFAAANRDPAVFDDPDQAVIDRAVNRHASSGLGVHRCLGPTWPAWSCGKPTWRSGCGRSRRSGSTRRSVHWYGGQVRSISTLPLLLDDGGAAAPGDAG